MSTEELLEKAKYLEQVGVLRALIFLREGQKITRQFEEIMSIPTWTKTARQILVDLGYVQITIGKRRWVIHSLTEKGKRVSDILLQLLNEI